MQELRQNLLYGLRLLRRSPVFAVAAILALAGGIGANTALFSLVNAVLIRDLPFSNVERLVWIWSTRPDRDRAFFSIPNFNDYRAECKSFERIGAFANWAANLTGSGEADRLQGARLTPDGFEILGVRAAIGRTLVPEDGSGGGRRVVVLAHGLWVRRFGGDPAVLGRGILLNGEPYTVIGVLPEAFFLPNTEPGSEIYAPLVLESDPRRTDRGANFLRAFGRLAPGVTADRARAEMAAIAASLRQRYPDENAGNLAPNVKPLREEVVGPYRTPLQMLLGSVGVVLLIACANIASLQIARAAGRRREIAVRMALGATRGRLARQFLAESLLLALGGGALGVLLAAWGLEGLLALSPAELPRIAEVSLDGRVLLFTLGVSLVAGLATGLAPAWRASRADLDGALIGSVRAAGRSTGGARTQSVLVVLEVAASLTLLIGAGLLLKSFARLVEVPSGIDPRGILCARLALPGSSYATPEKVAAFHEALQPRLLALPGVSGAAMTSVLPMTNVLSRADFTIAGQAPATPAEMPSAQNRSVSAGYFEVMGIPVIAGRSIAREDAADSRAVAVVDATLARRYFSGADPVGTHLRLDDGGGWRDVEVVGVVGTVKLAALEEEPAPTIYVPFTQLPRGALASFASRVNLVVKGAPEPLAFERGVRLAVQTVDRDVPLSGVRTMQGVVATAVALRKFNLTLMTILACAAVLLAASGLYALIAGNVASRTREIGIRMALGARRGDVLLGVIAGSARLAAAGLAAGMLGSLALARSLSGLLFEVRPWDPATFLVMTLSLGSVALLASLVPALRATRVDPALTLRME